MDIDRLIEIEIQVREMLAELEAQIQHAEKTVQPPGQLDGTEGRLSRQDSMLQHEMAKEGVRRMHERRRLLRDAIAKMDEGTYGICANCREDIELARLEAQPATFVCAGYQC